MSLDTIEHELEHVKLYTFSGIHSTTKLTFSRWGQGRGAWLRVAKEHLLVKASQGMIRGVGVLLDKDVTGWHNVHHYHFNCDSTWKEKLRRQISNKCWPYIKLTASNNNMMQTFILRFASIPFLYLLCFLNNANLPESLIDQLKYKNIDRSISIDIYLFFILFYFF